MSDKFLDNYQDVVSIQDIFSEKFFVVYDLNNKKFNFRIKSGKIQSFYIINNNQDYEYYEHNDKRYAFIENENNDDQEGLLIFGNPVTIIYFSKAMKIGERTFREFFKKYGTKDISYKNNSLIIKSNYTGKDYTFTISHVQENSDQYFNVGRLDENHENFDMNSRVTVCGGGTKKDYCFLENLVFNFSVNNRMGRTVKELNLKFENQEEIIPLKIESFYSNKTQTDQDDYNYNVKIKNSDNFYTSYTLSSVDLIKYLKAGIMNENTENNLQLDDLVSDDYDKDFLDKSEEELDKINDKNADDPNNECNILLVEEILNNIKKKNSLSALSNQNKIILTATIVGFVLAGIYFHKNIQNCITSFNLPFSRKTKSV